MGGCGPKEKKRKAGLSFLPSGKKKKGHFWGAERNGFGRVPRVLSFGVNFIIEQKKRTEFREKKGTRVAKKKWGEGREEGGMPKGL